MATINCINCDKPFEPKRADAKFCSDVCRKNASRILDKKAMAIKSATDMGYTIRKASALPQTVFIHTGFAELDAIIKGFPRKRITEVYGPASVGKSTMMLATMANMADDTKILYIDAENALDAAWVSNFKITAEIDIADPILLEEATQLVISSLPFYDLIVFDSVASILFKTENETEPGTANIGIKAKLMTSFMRRLIGPLARSNTAMVFINQEKPTIGDMYGPKWYTPGGKALEYTASLRLRLTSNKADRISIKGTKVGKRVTAEITKSKVGAPDRTATFDIYYESQKDAASASGGWDSEV